jgi:hypothetical protein
MLRVYRLLCEWQALNTMLWDTDLNVPAGQLVQAPAPERDKVPSGQSWQADWASCPSKGLQVQPAAAAAEVCTWSACRHLAAFFLAAKMFDLLQVCKGFIASASPAVSVMDALCWHLAAGVQ